MEKPRYVVGVGQNTDGADNRSRALIWHREHSRREPRGSILSAEELRQWMHALNDSEWARRCILLRLARAKQCTPEEILHEFRQAATKRIRETNRGYIRHYHRTSRENLRRIVQSGIMLSRIETKKRFSDAVGASSASENIMMTRDVFDATGRLLSPGYSFGEAGIGAVGDGAILVFRPTIMGKRDYDATRRYPEAAEIPLQEYCEAILVQTEQDRVVTEQLLREHGFTIPVMLARQWRQVG